MDIPITEERLTKWLESNQLVQNAFPDLNADQREFLMTGITPEEWETLAPQDDSCPRCGLPDPEFTDEHVCVEPPPCEGMAE